MTILIAIQWRNIYKQYIQNYMETILLKRHAFKTKQTFPPPHILSRIYGYTMNTNVKPEEHKHIKHC